MNPFSRNNSNVKISSHLDIQPFGDGLNTTTALSTPQISKKSLFVPRNDFVSKMPSPFSTVKNLASNTLSSIRNVIRPAPTTQQLEQQMQMTLRPEVAQKIKEQMALKYGAVKIPGTNDSYVDPNFVGALERVAGKIAGKIYKVANKQFLTVKEAVNYKNELDLRNRDNMFDKSKQIDTTIREVETHKEIPKIITDISEVQKVKNSIAEGKSILKSGITSTGRKMSDGELSAVAKSVNSA